MRVDVRLHEKEQPLALELAEKAWVTVSLEHGGPRGERGEKGDPLRFSDLSAEEKAQLKGEKGDPLRFTDLTPSQKKELKGEKGEKGDPLRFTDLTGEQKAELKGAKGDKGDPLRFVDLTAEQKAELKGAKGDKGDPLRFTDLTTQQKAELKGAKGDKGDPFRFTDLSAAQKEELRGPKGDPGKGFSVQAADPLPAKGSEGVLYESAGKFYVWDAGKFKLLTSGETGKYVEVVFIDEPQFADPKITGEPRENVLYIGQYLTYMKRGGDLVPVGSSYQGIAHLYSSLETQVNEQYQSLAKMIGPWIQKMPYVLVWEQLPEGTDLNSDAVKKAGMMQVKSAKNAPEGSNPSGVLVGLQTWDFQRADTVTQFWVPYRGEGLWMRGTEQMGKWFKVMNNLDVAQLLQRYLEKPAQDGKDGQVLTKRGTGVGWSDLPSGAAITIVNDLTTGGADKALSAEQGKILQANKVEKITGKGLSTNDYDNAAKAKVDAIPANPKYTDTTYTNATTSASGLMSAADKAKSDSWEGVVAIGNKNLNEVYAAGMYSTRNCTNIPPGGAYGAMLVMRTDMTLSGTGTDTAQMYLTMDNKIYVRNCTDKSSGQWTAWRDVSVPTDAMEYANGKEGQDLNDDTLKRQVVLRVKGAKNHPQGSHGNGVLVSLQAFPEIGSRNIFKQFWIPWDQGAIYFRSTDSMTSWNKVLDSRDLEPALRDVLKNPSGGSAGQVLTKTSDGVAWANAPAGVQVVNDLTTGGADKALSAEQGKVLFQSVDSGKTELARAIIDKGMTGVTKDSSFSDLAGAIQKMVPNIPQVAMVRSLADEAMLKRQTRDATLVSKWIEHVKANRNGFMLSVKQSQSAACATSLLVSCFRELDEGIVGYLPFSFEPCVCSDWRDLSPMLYESTRPGNLETENGMYFFFRQRPTQNSPMVLWSKNMYSGQAVNMQYVDCNSAMFADEANQEYYVITRNKDLVQVSRGKSAGSLPVDALNLTMGGDGKIYAYKTGKLYGFSRIPFQQTVSYDSIPLSVEQLMSVPVAIHRSGDVFANSHGSISRFSGTQNLKEKFRLTYRNDDVKIVGDFLYAWGIYGIEKYDISTDKARKLWAMRITDDWKTYDAQERLVGVKRANILAFTVDAAGLMYCVLKKDEDVTPYIAMLTQPR